MTIAYFLTRPDADLETSIYARICYEGFKFKYYIPEKINPKFWNKETRLAKTSKQFKEHPEFNARLDNIKSDIKNVYRKYINDNGEIPSPSTLRLLLNKEIKKHEVAKASPQTFFSFFEDFINRSKEGNRINIKSKKATVQSTNKGFVSTFNHLKAFQGTYKRKIDFATIDLEFYTDYVKYLTKKALLSNNTIGDHIKRLKTVLNEASEKGIETNPAYKSKYFAKLTEVTDSIYLTKTELQEIEALDLSNSPKLEKVRDLFLIGCHTGLRYSDYTAITPQNIKDGYIEIVQTKTGTPVVTPVNEAVDKIIMKYNGQLPKGISNQKTNDYLKEVGQIVKSLGADTTKTITKGGLKVTEHYQKWELLSTHTARRTFATNQYLEGVPTISIMAVTGHKTEKAFLKYIKLTPNEHAKIIKDHWQKQILKAV